MVFSKGPMKFSLVALKTGKQILICICHQNKKYTLHCLKEHVWVGCPSVTTLRRSITVNVGPKCWTYPALFQPASPCNHMWHKLYSGWGHAFFPFSLHMHVNCFHVCIRMFFIMCLHWVCWYSMCIQRECFSFMSNENRIILSSQQISVDFRHTN